MERFDAIVIGGGPAGAAGAIGLARAGWSVAVIERKEFPRRKVCGEYLSATNWPLLETLGVADQIVARAGPEIRRVGLFSGTMRVDAPLPRPAEAASRWGFALGRDQLDSALLEQARREGADVRQPWSAVELHKRGPDFVCLAESMAGPTTVELTAPVLIAAHGSWDRGKLPTQPARRRPRAGDLFGFKAHFLQTALAPDLMPLLSFPGGYGGMAHADQGRTSLSCCLRRDVLGRLSREKGEDVGEAVLRHIRGSTLAVDEALAPAVRDGRWLSAGPIWPGIRPLYEDGIFRVGNAAGEAHPAVAEGISMALQAGWLLAACLSRPSGGQGRDDLAAVGGRYSSAWMRMFARRIRAAAVVAQWAMRPAAVQASVPLIERLPVLLTWGARQSGKARSLLIS